MSAELGTPWAEEVDFAHNANDNKPAKGYMITIFRDEWTIGHNNADIQMDWSTALSFLDIQSSLNTVAPELTLKYMHYTIEMCPTTQRVHAHLIIYFDKSTRFKRFLECDIVKSWDRKQFQAIYNLEGAITYCSKTHTKSGELTRIDGPFTWGTSPSQGKRNDLIAAIDHLQENQWNTRSVAEEYPAVFVKFNKGLSKLAEVRSAKPAADKLENIICICGFPGSGKTTFAYTLHPDSTYSRAYNKYSNLYFDGYRNEDAILMDEFGGHVMQFDMFKRLFQPGMDPRRNTLSLREDSVPMGSRTVILISNRLPTMWWDLGKLRANPRELFRRFTAIYWFGGEYGSTTNPSWNKCFTGDDKYNFMDVCVRARAESWDDEVIHSTMTYKYKPKPEGFDVEMLDDFDDTDDVTTHSDEDITQHTRARKRTRYMNLLPRNALPQGQPFLD